MKSKKCIKCGKEKELKEFYKDKCFKDGYKSKCKECCKIHISICTVCNKEFRSEKKNQKFCSSKCQGIYNQKRIKVKCDYCGKEYDTTNSLYKGKEHHYCSEKCRNKGHSINQTGKLKTSTISNCTYCGETMIRKSGQLNKNIFCCRKCYNLWQSEKLSGENSPSYKGGLIELECNYCGKKIFKKKSQIANNNYCSVECMGNDRKNIYSGENNSNWNGGITNISEYLRHSIKDWKLDTLKFYNYKCDITHNRKNLIVHHLYNFNLILKELFEITNIEIKQTINDYTDEELNILKEKCLELHYKYGLGVVLSEDIHKKFHSIYGKVHNTKEQYYEFKNNNKIIKKGSD